MYFYNIMNRLSLCWFLLMICLFVNAQDFSNKGKDFWVGYGSHVAMYNSKDGTINGNGGSQNMVLYFTSDHDATVTVDMPYLGYTKTYQVKADSVTISDPIPKTAAQDARITEEGVSNKGIHISSDFSIIAYAHIYDGSVSGASLLFPTNTLGRSYYSINYKQVSNNPYSYCYAYVIATEDSTNVEIIPSANTMTHKAGEAFVVSLNKGQVYNIFGNVLTSSANASTGEDLTGTKIRSIATATSTCKRIAVFSGSGKINISDNNAKTADNYIQQALPSSAWGKKYLTVPTAKMSNNIFRVAVSDPAAVVKLNGNIIPNTTLNNNFYYEFQSYGANAIESDLPIMVAQYITTTGSYGNTNNNNGDPEMIYLSPIEQTINKVTINSTPFAKIVDSLHFVNITIPKNGAASLKVDGVTPSNPVVHPGDINFYYYQVALRAGAHTIVSDSGFNAIAYGYGNVESYGYNAGTNVIDLYQKLTVNNQFGTVKLPATCRGTPFKVSITLPYIPLSLQWNIPKYNNIPTNYAPTYDSTYVVNGKTIYRYSLDQYLTYDSVGTYNIQLKVNNPTTDGCSGEQVIDFDLVVYSPPHANFQINSTHCVGDTLYLNDNTLLGPDDRKLIAYNWKLGSLPFVNAKNYAVATTVAGTMPIQYFVITDIGCLSDTVTTSVRIDSAAKPNFNIQNSKCLGKSIQFVDSTFAVGGAKLNSWVWDYGDHKQVDSMNSNNAVTHIFDAAINYDISLKVTTLNGCASVKTKTIKVNPNPVVGFSLPKICLNDAFAQFIDTSSIADQSNHFAYSWNFGDNSNTTASNTDTAANPRHRYLSAGTYQVFESVKSVNGCISDTTESFTVNGAFPKSDFTIQNKEALCSNKPVQLTNLSTVDFGSIGQVIIYWDYLNNPSDTTIDNNPSINKAYQHSYNNYHYPDKTNFDIHLAAYSGLTCFNENKDTVSIVPPPASFSISASKDYVCIADSVHITSIVAGGVAPFTDQWNVDNTIAYFNGNELIGTNNGSVSISVKLMDAKHCVYPFDSVKTFEVRGIPVANLSARDTSVCNQDPVILLGSGSNTYHWILNKQLFATNHVDSLITTTPGVYQLQVNDGYCNSLLSNAINISQYIIPKYFFSTPNYLCVNTKFPINTNAINARGARFYWNFGDSSYSNMSNPVEHAYSKYGTYQIKLNYTNDYCPKYDSSVVGDTIKIVNPIQANAYTFFVLSDVDTLLSNIKIDSGYTQYSWTPLANLSSSIVAHPIFRGTRSVDYVLSRKDIVSNCVVEDIYHVVVSNDVAVSVPKAFTPNRDGLNDVLKIEYGAGLKTFNYFKLFNRWGKLVFETTNVNDGWDGKVNGRDQDMDAYTYLLDYITFKDEHINKTGSVILLR